RDRAKERQPENPDHREGETMGPLRVDMPKNQAEECAIHSGIRLPAAASNATPRAARLLGGSGVVLDAEQRDRRLKVLERLEGLVHAREPQVRNLIQLPQRGEKGKT